MNKVNYLEIHTNKSEEWVRSYMKLKNLAWFSSFFKYEYGNLAIFCMLHMYESEIAKWLQSEDKNPFQGVVAVERNLGFVIFDDNSRIVTKAARVILAKDKSKRKGYIVKNCFPCLTV